MNLFKNVHLFLRVFVIRHHRDVISDTSLAEQMILNVESSVCSHINTHLVEMVMSRNVARYSVFVGVTELSAAGISLILGIVSKNVESSPWLLVLPFVVSS